MLLLSISACSVSRMVSGLVDTRGFTLACHFPGYPRVVHGLVTRGTGRSSSTSYSLSTWATDPAIPLYPLVNRPEAPPVAADHPVNNAPGPSFCKYFHGNVVWKSIRCLRYPMQQGTRLTRLPGYPLVYLSRSLDGNYASF